MNENKRIITIFSLLLFFLVWVTTACAADAQKHNYKPSVGYVPDQETAIRIAVAIWIPIYGKEQIERERPYKAILKNGIWYVTGSLPEGSFGGVAEAEINKESGCIIRISHGQ